MGINISRMHFKAFKAAYNLKLKNIQICTSLFKVSFDLFEMQS